MTDVKELRINNIFKCDGQFLIIKKIAENDCDVTVCGKISRVLNGETIQWGNSIDITLSEILPIALNEEILLKCGFADSDDLINFFSEYLKKFSFKVNTEKGCVTIHADEDRYFFPFGSIENLHQFQNLYFDLTGGELEINLEPLKY